MPTKITMPQLGESVSEGTVGRWLKQEGDLVEKDEPLVEIVTDKITEEMPSPYSGTLTHILVKENQTVKVGADIAFMEASTATPESAVVGAISRGSNATGDSTGSGAPAPSATPEGSNGLQLDSGSREKVSPLARRLAQEHAIDLHRIQGSGEGGRVRKEDILAYLATQDQPELIETVRTSPISAPPPSAPVVPVFVGDEVITPSPSRRAIAEHMVRSKHTSPHATTLVEVDMTLLARWLEQHKDEFKQREGIGISYQTFAIKATVEALKEYPYLNASWTEDGKIVLRKQIHIGVSIALPDKLIVPVIHNADTLNLAGDRPSDQRPGQPRPCQQTDLGRYAGRYLHRE